MNRRRPHHKSRNGCLQCKRRRVKCDEQRPRCTKCVNHDTKCHYVSMPGTLVWADEQSTLDLAPSDQPSLGGHVSQEPLPRHRTQFTTTPISSQDVGSSVSAASLNPAGLELMVNWFLSTIHSVSDNDEASRRRVQELISREAMAHEFLMHGILALSALDLANQKAGSERIKYKTVAHAHYNRGLSIFGPKLQNITAHNYCAVIAFSSITTTFSFASSRPNESSHDLAIVDDLAELFHFARGWNEVVKASEGVGQPGLKAIRSPPDGAGEISVDANEALNHLQGLNEASGSRHVWHETEVYTTAIDTLRTMFKSLKDNQKNPHLALAWGNLLPARFIELLQEHQTFALIVIAHFCVVLHRIRQVWWLKGWSRGLLGVIWANIDPAHHTSLSWPKAKIMMETGFLDSLE